jgi:hypothetical protein
MTDRSYADHGDKPAGLEVRAGDGDLESTLQLQATQGWRTRFETSTKDDWALFVEANSGACRGWTEPHR